MFIRLVKVFNMCFLFQFRNEVKTRVGFFFLIFHSKDVFKSQFIALSDHIE